MYHSNDVSIAGNTIKISMLGGFELRCGTKSVGDSENRSYQLWRALEYLTTFRSRDVSQIEMIEALWPGEELENPSNALKNLVYRIRVLLKEADFPAADEMILFHRGAYRWNNKLNIVVDCEEFESLANQSEDLQLSDEERVEKYLLAISLYKGNFLPKSAYEIWVIPLAVYYQNRYLQCVRDAVVLLHTLGRQSEIVKLCEGALAIDAFDEGLNEALIRAFIDLGKSQNAISHYDHVTKLFYDELGVKPSASLRGLYREIIKNISHVETDLDTIKEDLTESNSTSSGAFICEYEVFRNIYQLLARSASRSGSATFVVLLTLVPTDEQHVPQDQLAAWMKRLADSFCNSLRRGDMAARFSPTQYVLMLPSLTFENGQMVTQRLIKTFKRDNPRFPLSLTASLQPLEPLAD